MKAPRDRIANQQMRRLLPLVCASPSCHVGSADTIDLETDSKIQETIRREFNGKTLLCIAHRLRTIISYDRILVMSAGEVAVSRSGQANG
jgi:hypothetical protein